MLSAYPNHWNLFACGVIAERAAAASNSQKEVDVRVHQRLAWRYCAPVKQFGERRQCPLADH